ncbi:probable Na(+)/H(+) antiporter nhx-9 isoform X2 [Penaeus vannamei]|uniref:probable Na(+)/H(+) antiporter nhx-9 isoform X2 n=1 Tax=Penaeus vannamei TaxID=6689 RepID=UPI00387F7883
MARFLLTLGVMALALVLVSANTPTESAHIATTVPTHPMAKGADVTDHSVNATHLSDHGGGGHGGKLERYPVAVIDFERVQTPFIIGLWIFCACLGKIGFHMAPKLSHIFPESCMLIVLGVFIGLLLFYTNAASVSPLTADVFFLYMLPPIILDAGYFMPNRLFFDHLGTILVFAVVGTIWNCLTIGISMYAVNLTGLFGVDVPMLHMFLFAALISAVDPVAVLAVFEEIHVEEVLYILVFGESLLNDGVTVVLYHMFEAFGEIGEENVQVVDILSGIASFLLVCLGGVAIGIIWGFLTAFVTRFTNQVRVIEPIFVFVMSYLAYLNAEIFHLSGILAITFCGITMKNYVEQNISTKSHTTIKYAMKMLASSSETIIFMFLGVSTVQYHHDWNTWFVVMTILFCSVYRTLGTLIFSSICNRFRVKKISFTDKFVISYGGLRGAVAFALVLTINSHHIPFQPMFLTATIAMVYFTVFVQGITIKPLVQMLGVKRAEKRTLTMNERLHERSMDYIMAGIEDLMGKHGNFMLRDKFKRFNNKYITPFLVREQNIFEPKILETYSQIKMQEAMENMSNSNSTNNIESFTALLRNAVASQQFHVKNAGEWNLDVAELDYNPNIRDLNEAKFHHVLSEEYKPIKRHRGSTYKRHAVKDDDVRTQTDVNHHNMYLHTRQFVSTINRATRKPRKPDCPGAPVSPRHLSAFHFSQIVQFIDSMAMEAFAQQQNGVVKTPKTVEETRAAYQQNGSAIKLKNDYIGEVLRDNPAYEDTEMDGSFGYRQEPSPRKRVSTSGPTVAETALPWKRYTDEDAPTSARKLQRTVSLKPEEEDTSTPAMAEVLLPWKRPEDEVMCDKPLRQSEFPAWASNKEYVGYYSPSNTFLGGIGIKDHRPNIRDIFGRRSSSTSLGSRRGSVKETPSPLATPTHQPDVQQAVRRRSSTGDNSLLNTTITEEDARRDHVIEMDPDGGTQDTKM